MTRPASRKLTLAIGLALAGSAFSVHAAAPPRPTVVELFTSQGCSSCPPANVNHAALSDRPDVLALSFGVTYWDQLGWKDTFAHPAFTSRQHAYARALGHSAPFTPQVVVDGRADVVGNKKGSIEALIRRSARRGGPAVSFEAGRLRVGSGAATRGGADVWLVRYDPRTVQVPVRRGENGGRTLPHKNVVKDLIRLGDWSGAPASYAVAGGAPGLRTAVIVQAKNGGPVLAAWKG
ncbi:MAG: DUF1223 domain-containing protein [Proteobacteria bacterium]|nr:DUF1223 domain-containing protein [Pseudomonadota bacterium]